MTDACALALGFFDGVHAAHIAILNETLAFARENSLPAIALTFDRQPAAFIKGAPEELICTPDERIALLRAAGMDEVAVLPFDEKLRDTPAREFAESVIFSRFGARFVAAGFDYRFGAGGAGDVDFLRHICTQHGAACSILPRLEIEGEKISSSAIRAYIARGESEKAALMLGRDFSFSGEVRHGKALGRRLGFPTMNIPLPDGIVLPRPGVYVCRAALRGQTHAAVCNISPQRLCEVFMLAHNEDAYGQTVRVTLLSFARPMRAFESAGELRAQVDFDKKTASDWFISHKEALF